MQVTGWAMCPHSASSLSQSWWLPSQACVLLSADGDEVNGAIEVHSNAGRHKLTVPSGGCCFLAAGDDSIRVHGGMPPVPLDVGELIRLLAFHDHARGVERPPSTERHAPLVLFASVDLSQSDQARLWLVNQLMQSRVDESFSLLMQLWAQTESYRIVRFILAHPGGVSVQGLADCYGLSIAQFRRLCQKALGRSLKEQLRLLRAGRVLLRYNDTGHSLTRLAADFGFASPSHFCTEIKSLLGKSPRAIYQMVKNP